VELSAQPVQQCPPGALLGCLSDPLVAIVLVPTGARIRPSAIGLELAPNTARTLIDRILGGEGEIAQTTAPLTDVERGVLAYFGASLTSRTTSAWYVGGVVTSPAALLALVGDEGAAAWPAQVTIGSHKGLVRAWIPMSVLADAPIEEISPTDSQAWSKLVLALTAEIATGVLDAATVASLRPGDTVVLEETWARLQRGTIAGTARVRIPGAHRTYWWCSIEPHRWTITRIDISTTDHQGKGKRMSSDPNTGAITSKLGDAPIPLSIELARFTLPLEELGSLRVGEVLTTGQPIGEHATLRAGDRAVATGELVSVDGEIGLRILKLVANGQ